MPWTIEAGIASVDGMSPFSAGPVLKFTRISLALIALGDFAQAQTAPVTTGKTPAKTTANTAVATKPADAKEIVPPPTKSASPFQFDIGVPVWGSEISGTVGVKGISGHTYVSFGQLWDHLDAVAPLTMDARYQKWGLHVDGQYAKLAEQFDTRDILFNSGTVTMEQAFANFNVNYEVFKNQRTTVRASLGGRYNYMSLGGTLTSRFPNVIKDRQIDGDVQWVDPVIGTTAKVHVYKPFSLLFLGDVGGFGVGSHLTYQFFGGGEVQLTRNLNMNLGYRYLYTNYSEGGNTYKADMSGPQLTVGVNF